MFYRRMLFLTTTLLFILSCEKEATPFVDVSTTIKTFDYYDLLHADTDGALYVMSTLANFGFEGRNQPKTYIRATSNEISILAQSEIVKLGENVSLTTESLPGLQAYPPDVAYEALYGKEVGMSYKLNSDQGIEKNLEQVVYSPDILSISANEYPLEITDEYLLEWNSDPLNEGNVYIIIDYHPDENVELSADYSERSFNFIAVEDDGSEVLKRSDFSNIPRGALVTLTVLRGVGYKDEVGDEENQSNLTFAISSATSGYSYFMRD